MGISTSNPDLFKAILAMDAYNRGYDAAIRKNGNVLGLGGSSIGLASIGPDSSTVGILNPGADSSIGFYASTYTLSGATTISIRGTDNKVQDVPMGYGLALGDPYSPQAQMALVIGSKECACSGCRRNSDVKERGHEELCGWRPIFGYGRRIQIHECMHRGHWEDYQCAMRSLDK